MMELSVRDASNREVRTVRLSEAIFGRAPRPDLVAMTVNYQLAKRRSGTADTKRRSEVSGGGRKPYRQKGTGHARQGTTRAPQFRHGGIVFGPHPRDYTSKLNKKVRKLALLSALSAKAAAMEIIVVESFGITEAKTKTMVQVLNGWGADRSALVVLAEDDATIMLSARNIPRVTVMRHEGVNVYDLLAHDKVVITEEALQKLEERLA
ncbi:MAG: 50S ribosomal protein L4 [Magnetococcales bacterium]|nr:50S ribosomal protein L4 [Magnetococcales bacterium]NGZ27503.1 50S ribosomal protein L4 [Magnetococcales bacterium]